MPNKYTKKQSNVLPDRGEGQSNRNPTFTILFEQKENSKDK